MAYSTATRENVTELAWAAGFFDGEGTTGSYPVKPGGPPYPRVQIEQIDREVLDRFCAAVGVGRVMGPYVNKTSFSQTPKWHWHAYGFEKTKLVRELLWPFLSTIKREQMDRALELAGEQPSLLDALEETA